MSLSIDGWDPVTFQEIRPGIAALWMQAYGDDADTDPSTPDGREVTLISVAIMLAFDVDTGLWNNSFFRSATSISLDRILDLFAKAREAAVKSTATAVFYGAPSTAIPVTTVVITANTNASRFATDAVDAIGADDNSVAWVSRILAAEAGITYSAQVNAEVPSSYIAGGGDDVVAIATGLRDDTNNDGFATATLAGVDSSGAALLVLEIIGGPGNMTVADDSASTVIDAFEAVRTAVTATEAGPVAASAGTLQDLANPIAGVTGVTNDADATIGQAEESDDAFRARHLQTMFANSARTEGGMKNAVASLPGVDENSVKSNIVFDPVDADGRPLGSTENIVLKTVDDPAADVDIANAIARQIPAGIRPYGLRSFGFGTTINGEVIEVFATDVEQLYLHLSITIVAGEGFPTGDIEGAVKTAVASYFDAGIIETSENVFTDTSAILVVGKDWLRTATLTPINIVTNTSSTNIAITSDVTAAPGDVPVFAAADQPADDRQIIRIDASRIAVSIS